MSGHQDEIEREERIIYVVIALACLPVVIAAFVHGGSLDGGASISLIMVVVAIVGLLGIAAHRLRDRRDARLPSARVRLRRAGDSRPPPR